MNYIFNNYFDIKRNAERLMNKNRKFFTLEGMYTKLGEILGEHLKDMPTENKLNLPKVKLPKLKKVTS